MSGDTSSSKEWALVGAGESSQLGTPERVKKLEQLKQRKTEHGASISANLW